MRFLSKLILSSALLTCAAAHAAAQTAYELRSPDGRVELRVRAGERVRFDVLFDGKALLRDSTLSLDVEGKRLGVSPSVRGTKRRSHDGFIEPPVRLKSARIRERYNELRLEMAGDYVVVARRSGRQWWVGAMNDWTARELEVDLSFLPPGVFRMESFRDGLNADRFAGDYKRVAANVRRTDKLKIRLAGGGGWAARISP